MTVLLTVLCPDCHSSDIIRHNKSPEGKQRYLCCEPRLPPPHFCPEYRKQRRTRLVLHQIVEMTLNGSGVRDIARVLHVSPATVIRELKKKRPISNQ